MKPTRSIQSSVPTRIPLFLAPAFAELSITPHSATRSFSSTTTSCAPKREKKDLNKRRGESVIRSTGPRRPLGVQAKYKELPKPRAEKDRPLDEFPTNPNHGLYGFFNKDKETVIPSEREEQHGRAWEYEELVFKNFSDLHAIYWQGLLEINRIRTRSIEHKRLKLGFGALELQERLATVKDTLINVRSVLKHRQEAFEEARLIKEQTQTMQGLDEFLEGKEAEVRRIEIVSDMTSFPRSSSVPEELPIPDDSQGQSTLPPRPN